MRYLLFIISFLFTSNLSARSGNPRYISVGAASPSLRLVVENSGVEEAETKRALEYAPKPPHIAFMGVSYLGLSGSLSTNLQNPQEEELEYTDYNLSWFHNWFGIEGTYSKFTRFHAEVKDGFSVTTLEKTDSFRDDMSILFSSGNIYLFPLRFGMTLMNGYDVSRIKKNSGIGFGTILSHSSTTITTDRGLIPDPLRDEFGADGQFETGTISRMGAQLAATAVLASEPFYLTFMGAVGPGVQNFQYDTNTESRSGKGIANKLSLYGAGGLSSHTLFAGVEGRMESPEYVLKHMRISVVRTEISAQIGLKF